MVDDMRLAHGQNQGLEWRDPDVPTLLFTIRASLISPAIRRELLVRAGGVDKLKTETQLKAALTEYLVEPKGEGGDGDGRGPPTQHAFYASTPIQLSGNGTRRERGPASTLGGGGGVETRSDKTDVLNHPDITGGENWPWGTVKIEDGQRLFCFPHDVCQRCLGEKWEREKKCSISDNESFRRHLTRGVVLEAAGVNIRGDRNPRIALLSRVIAQPRTGRVNSGSILGDAKKLRHDPYVNSPTRLQLSPQRKLTRASPSVFAGNAGTTRGGQKQDETTENPFNLGDTPNATVPAYAALVESDRVDIESLGTEGEEKDWDTLVGDEVRLLGEVVCVTLREVSTIATVDDVGCVNHQELKLHSMERWCFILVAE